MNMCTKQHSERVILFGAWRPVPIDRLETNLRLAAQFCERIVTWGYNEFCRPHLDAKGAQWYTDYEKCHQRLSV